jgi:hypothetical protein
MPIVAQTREERVIFNYSFIKLPDGCERWMLLWSNTYRNTNGENVVTFMKETFKPGQFTLWQCDNGPHFKNKAVKAAIKALGGSMVNSAPYYPKCNGQIERPGRQRGLHPRAFRTSA